MTNKKIASEIAVGIILIVAIIIGGLFYFNISKTAFGPGGMPIQNENSAIARVQKNSPALFKLGNTRIIKTQMISTAGGNIKIENSKTPLDGFDLAFESGAFDKDTEVSIGYNDGFFESLPSGIPTGKTIVIKTANSEKLNHPILISYSSDSKLVMGYAINSEGHLQSVDTVAYKPLVNSYTFNSNTTITWIYIN